MTTSAFFIISSKPIASATTSKPGRTVASQKFINPNPSPPAAPAPGTSRLSFPESRATISAIFARASSSCPPVSDVTPFCGPNTRVAPCPPKSGFLTSVAAIIFKDGRAGRSMPRKPPEIGERRDRFAFRVEKPETRSLAPFQNRHRSWRSRPGPPRSRVRRD